MTALDFSKRELTISEPFYTTENEGEDFNKIYQFYAQVKGKIPDQGMSHLHSNNTKII
jgi:hypothetical protein